MKTQSKKTKTATVLDLSKTYSKRKCLELALEVSDTVKYLGGLPSEDPDGIWETDHGVETLAFEIFAKSNKDKLPARAITILDSVDGWKWGGQKITKKIALALANIPGWKWDSTADKINGLVTFVKEKNKLPQSKETDHKYEAKVAAASLMRNAGLTAAEVAESFQNTKLIAGLLRAATVREQRA